MYHSNTMNLRYCSVSIYFNDKINEQTNETYLNCVIQVSRVCSLISPLIFILHYLTVMDYPAVGRRRSLPIDFHTIQKRLNACGYLDGAKAYSSENGELVTNEINRIEKTGQEKLF